MSCSITLIRHIQGRDRRWNVISAKTMDDCLERISSHRDLIDNQHIRWLSEVYKEHCRYSESRRMAKISEETYRYEDADTTILVEVGK